jgi:hypothetical protein
MLPANIPITKTISVFMLISFLFLKHFLQFLHRYIAFDVDQCHFVRFHFPQGAVPVEYIPQIPLVGRKAVEAIVQVFPDAPGFLAHGILLVGYHQPFHALEILRGVLDGQAPEYFQMVSFQLVAFDNYLDGIAIALV